MKTILPVLLGLLLLPSVGNAEAVTSRPYGSLFRTLGGERLEQQHNISLLGFAHVTAAFANHDISQSALPKGTGRNLQPQGGLVQDEGLNLQHLGLWLCKGAGCPPATVFPDNRNVLSRVTPLPGPRGDEVIVDWAVSAVFGENAVFWSTKGFDDFAWNADDAHRLSITQWYLDIYLPIGAGASVMLGSWHSPLAQEIGYAFDPPNWFSSRTYAFAASPSKHIGLLTQFKLGMDPAYGHASLGFGIVSDWNSLDFGSGAGGPSFMLVGRWRSPDMRTWIDLETLYGNGEDDFGDTTLVNGINRARGGGSQFLVLSSTDAYLDRFLAYLTVTHFATERLGFVFESLYGYQEGGDLKPLPFAVTRNSSFYGANAALRYRLRRNLHIGARLEWFADDNAANVLWSGVGASGGDVYATTLSLGWQPIPHLQIRPELKLDHYVGGGHLFAPGNNGLARRDTQLLGVMNFEFRF